MTITYFEEWVRLFDQQMHAQNRNVLLLLDNCPAHPSKIDGLLNTRLSFLPLNTTAKLQPCIQGIILAFKRYYRSSLLRRYLRDTTNLRILCKTCKIVRFYFTFFEDSKVLTILKVRWWITSPFARAHHCPPSPRSNVTNTILSFLYCDWPLCFPAISLIIVR